MATAWKPRVTRIQYGYPTTCCVHNCTKPVGIIATSARAGRFTESYGVARRLCVEHGEKYAKLNGVEIEG